MLIFYLTYDNDIPNIPKAQLALIADDNTFLTQNKNAKRVAIQLQQQLNLISGFFDLWRIKINPSKFISINFSHGHTSYVPSLQINNYTLHVDSHGFLADVSRIRNNYVENLYRNRIKHLH